MLSVVLLGLILVLVLSIGPTVLVSVIVIDVGVEAFALFVLVFGDFDVVDVSVFLIKPDLIIKCAHISCVVVKVAN